MFPPDPVMPLRHRPDGDIGQLAVLEPFEVLVELPLVIPPGPLVQLGVGNPVLE